MFKNIFVYLRAEIVNYIMVDYTQQKLRPIIYKERKDLDEFDVDNEKSMDCFMLERIEKSPVIDMEGANRYILDLFNQVYYIITLILMEKRPVHYFKKYLAIASHTSSYYFNLSSNGSGAQIFECIVMTMVYNYLQECSALLGENIKALLVKISEHYQSFKVNNEIRAIFYNCVISEEKTYNYEVDLKVFEPLSIPTDEEAQAAPANQLEEQEEKYRKLANDYVELGKEMDDLKNEVFMLRSENNKKNRQEDEDQLEQMKADEEQQQDAVGGNPELHQMEEEEFENIDANQKIRMEVAYRLMRKAGMKPHGLTKQRIAEFMSMLLDIKSDNARGNKAQTCATYISARLNDKKKNAFALEINKNTTDDVKSRAKELGMDITLDDDPA